MKLAPSEFWAMSLAEWRWLTAPAQSPALSRKGLARLIALYPDDRP